MMRRELTNKEELVEKFYNKIQELRDIIQELYG